MQAVVDVLPLDAITTLVTRSEYAILSAKDFFTLFGACRSLRHLVVIDFCGLGLWAALTLEYMDGTQPMFPVLECLTFDGVDLNDNERPLKKRLIDRDVAAPGTLKVVRFFDCDLKRTSLKKIKFPKVIWNGSEELPHGEEEGEDDDDDEDDDDGW
ncbi:hypothetical protein EVG20_g11462 [Dentipellis fragilis]|uniref:F-box domain-containing protein n=1 Tax=Dentipellis fragilis TaxID=205917 RepID=A0A4Y9XKM5_9AGAM|nr:hypothetical protein EVG20_g11462 [Dentipellis fragilis]